jgi:UTP--glucose-1-phosphate uridylyltransferase
MSAFNKFNKDVVALTEVTRENARGIGNSGRVDVMRLENDIYKIERFYSKSTGHFTARFHHELRACGIFIAGPHLFDYIRRLRPPVQDAEFTDVPVRNAILEERGCLGYRTPGTVFDIGIPPGYELCLKNIS